MEKPVFTLVAAMLVTFVLGSVHGFSVFVVPLETLLELPRSQISLIYSLALVSITCAVLFGYRVYASMPAAFLVLITIMIAACGLLIAARATNWWMLFVGYSLMFGLSNGLGYGFALQLVGRELPRLKGFAMGAVTASYAIGSIVFAKIFSIQILADSVSSAFTVLAQALFSAALAAALLMWFAGSSYGAAYSAGSSLRSRVSGKKVFLFWTAYLFSVFAGLMAIGHAAGIAIAHGAPLSASVWSAMMVGFGSAAGGFGAGALVDKWPVTRFLFVLPLVSAAALSLISFAPPVFMTIVLLTVVGFCYGSLIAIYPVAISDYFGEMGPMVYGRVFTAWGVAGLSGPWLAGFIYDTHSSYKIALMIASITALFSALTVKLSHLEVPD